MKRALIPIGIVVALVAAAILYLYATVPTTVRPVAAPFGSAALGLIAQVPAGATDIAYARRIAAVYRKGLDDPIAGPPLRQFSERAGLARLPLLLGSSDAVLWRSDEGGFGFAARPDILRRALLHLYLALSGRDDLTMEKGALLMNAGDPGAPATPSGPATAAAELESLAAGLPPADLVVLQREGSRGAFPPIGRPAVTAVRLTGPAILLDSLSRPEEGTPLPLPLSFAPPPGAMLSIAMARPPRLAGELNRLFATRVTPLLDAGGMLVVYDVESKSLLPRPLGVVVLRADDAHRAALSAFVSSLASMGGSGVNLSRRRVGAVEVETREAFGLRVETAETRSELLLSFDKSSIDRYLGEPPRPAADASPAIWNAVVVPSTIIPMIDHLSRSPGFRIISPKLYRAAGDLQKWLAALGGASSVVVRKDLAGGAERLRVTINAK